MKPNAQQPEPQARLAIVAPARGRPTRNSRGVYEDALVRMAATIPLETMLRLSFAPTLTTGMADTLSGRRDAAQMLALLDDSHLCEVKPGHTGAYYILQSGFRDFLRTQARLVFTDAHIGELQRLSANLLEEEGMPESAILLFLECASWPAAVSGMRRQASQVADAVQARAWLDLLERVPPQARTTLPDFYRVQGRCLLLLDPGRAASAFESGHAVSLTVNDHASAIYCLGGMITAHRLCLRTDTEAAMVALEGLLAAHEGGLDGETRLLACTGLLYGGWTQTLPRRRLARIARTVRRLSGEPADACLRALASIALLFQFIFAGSLARAQAFIRTAGALFETHALPALLPAWWGTARAVYYLMADEDECVPDALACAGTLVSQREGGGFPEPLFHFLQVCASLGCADVPRCAESIERLAEAVNRHPDGLARTLLSIARAWLALQHHRTGEGLAHSRAAMCLPDTQHVPVVKFHALLTRACALLQNGETAEASRLHQAAVGVARQLGGDLLAYRAMIFEAQLCLDTGDVARLRTTLAGAFQTARHRRLRPGLLFAQPDVLSRLCLFALEHGIDTRYVSSLIQARRLHAPCHGLTEAWPWSLKIRTLGAFQLSIDGAVTEPTGKAQRRPLELLKAIIAYGGKGVDTSLLATVLWPDASGDAAHSSFDITLYRLRKLLGYDDVLSLTDKKVSLNAERCWLDTWEFDQVVSMALDTMDRPDSLQQVEGLPLLARRVIGLYRADFLHLEESQPWIVLSRQKLHGKLIRFVTAAGRTLEQAGQCDIAIDLYRRGIESDPLAEELYLRLIECYRSRGQFAEAIGVYRRCREMLSIVLGIQPSERTTAVFRACLGH